MSVKNPLKTPNNMPTPYELLENHFHTIVLMSFSNAFRYARSKELVSDASPTGVAVPLV